MRARIAFLVVAGILAALNFKSNLHAQMLVNVETVIVGDAGNAADTRSDSYWSYPTQQTFGAVADVFAIGKYEVTIGQYTTFLNSVASVTSDSYITDLWNPGMQNNLNIAGISRSGGGTVGNPYTYSTIGPSGITPSGASSPGNRPIAYVSWFDAARFANWMNNGAINGASTETGAYTLNGATTGIITKNAGATWWIPSEDEWYKAAYYKGGGTNAGYWVYPTQSDTIPGNTIGDATNQANYFAGDWAVTQAHPMLSSQNYLTDVGAFGGSAGPYGTYDQAGNISEWTDAVTGSDRKQRGGILSGSELGLRYSWSYPMDPTYGEFAGLGFRVASVPEPSTYALLLMTGAGALWLARRRRLSCGN